MSTGKPTWTTALATLLFAVTALLAEGQKGFRDSLNPHVERWAYILQSAKWPDSIVYVCWENPGAASAAELKWVETAIAESWQAHSGLRFKGWGQCAVEVEGIRILIEDSGPHVKFLGYGLNGLKNGMVLNFTFQNWSVACRASEDQRRRCVESIAVHEFGHAIGFSHEQNRPDAPGECAALRQGEDGDLAMTPYDPSSVMNYCNSVYNNNGALSSLDSAAVRELYPPVAQP